MARSRPTLLRAFTVVVALRAAKALPQAHPGWERVFVREVESIPSDIEALIWVIGCLWAIRVERFVGKSQPGLNCILFLAGLFLASHSLLRHLVGSGVASSGVPPAGASHGVFIFLVFLCAVVLVAIATPGTAPRRVFCAVAFPFLALLALLSTALGGNVVHAMIPEAGFAVNAILLGPLFGFVVAAILVLPCVLLYREAAAPIAALALIPAMLERLDAQGMAHLLNTQTRLFDQCWPFLCSMIVLAIVSRVLLIWVGRPPGERACRAV